MPFAVPFEGGREVVEGLVEVIDRELGGGGAEGAGVEFLDFPVHREERVGGALDHAGDIGGDVGDRLEVLAVEVAPAGGALDADEFGERDERRGGVEVGADVEGEDGGGLGAVGDGDVEDDGQVFALVGQTEEIDRAALRGEGEGLVDRGDAHAVQGGFLAVDHVADLGLVGLDEPIDVHGAGRALDDAADGGSEGETLRFGGAVDLGDDGLEDGRTGRDLGDGDGGAVALGDGGEAGAEALGDGVALVGAFALADEVDLDVGDVGAAPEEGVADETVEIKRSGGAGVDLVVADGGIGADGGGHLGGDAGGLLERGALGRVQDDLELRLVVEGEHLDRDGAEEDEGDGGEQQADDAGEERPTPAGAVEQRIHDAVVEPRKPIGGRMVGIVGVAGEGGGAAAEDADGGPRRDGEGDHEGEKHRSGGADRDRPHVGAHESADEGHGENRGDDGPRGEDRGVAHLVHGGEGELAQGFLLGAGETRVADDVFYDDDGVVHEDADGEDQREERDPVERVTVEVKYEEREREGRGDGEENDKGFPPAEENEDEDRDAEDGDAHVEQEFVALLGGGVAIVARDRDGDGGGDERAAEGVDLGEGGVDDVDGVGAGALR